MKKNLVIVPTYNEAENIEELVSAVMGLKYPFDILVVDDNSPDGTAGLVEALQLKFHGCLHLLKRPRKEGLGPAYMEAFQWALDYDYDFIFEMDADFSHDPNDLIKLYRASQNGEALAIGSRYVNGVNIVNWPMSRLLMSFFASKYVKFITGMPVNDSTAGFKCYNREILEAINLDKIQFIGYAFQIEMKFKAWKYGFDIIEVPVIFTDRKEGKSKMSSNIFFEAVLGVIQMKLSSLFKSWKR